MKMIILILSLMLIMVLLVITASSQTSKEEEKPTKQTIKTEYTYNSKIEEYSDNTGNAIIYSGMRYADSSGTKIEEARSLKTCEFCNNIKLSIDVDEKYPLSEKDIIGYNYTSITLRAGVSATELNKDIPIEVYSKENVIDDKTGLPIENKITEYSSTINLKSIDEKAEVTLPFGIEKEVHIGENSTILYFTSIGADVTSYDSTTGGQIDARTNIRFSLSGAPNLDHILLESVTANFYVLGLTGVDNAVTIYRINNQTWTESILAAEYDNLLVDTETSKTWSTTDTGVYTNTNISAQFEVEDGIFLSLIFEDDDTTWDGSTKSISDGNYLYTKEDNNDGYGFCDNEGTGPCDASTKPFINLSYRYYVYNLTISSPTTSSPISVEPSDKLTLRFNFSWENSLITSGIEQENVTIGGDICIPSTNPTQPNLTTQSCSGYYGQSCDQSSPEFDNTHDDCSSFNNPYDDQTTIENIYLNSTSIISQDHIKLTCQYDPYAANDEYYMYINKPDDSWAQIYSGVSGNGNVINLSVNYIANDSGQYWLRCSIDSAGQNDECTTGSVTYDNDDITFTVVSGVQNEFVNNDLGWELNCTVPAGCTGDNDLFVNATYGSFTANQTQIDAVTCAGADTCTYSSGDWDVDSTDECTISSEVNGDSGSCLTITGDGGSFIANELIKGFSCYNILTTNSRIEFNKGFQTGT